MGLDLEVDFREVAPLAQGDLTPFITAATNRLINPQQLSDAKAVVSSNRRYNFFLNPFTDPLESEKQRKAHELFSFLVHSPCESDSRRRIQSGELYLSFYI